MVCHENGRGSVGVGGEHLQTRHQFFTSTEVETGRRFVEQQQFGIDHQRPGHEHSLALAFGQRAERPVRQVLGAHRLEHLQRLVAVDLVVDLFPATQDRITRGDHQITDHLVGGDAIGQQGRRHADPCGQLAHLGPPDRLTEQESASAARMGFGGGHPQQRGLARTIGSEDHPPFVEFHLPGDGPDEVVALTSQHHIFEVDQQVWIRFTHPPIVPHGVRRTRRPGRSVGNRTRKSVLAGTGLDHREIGKIEAGHNNTADQRGLVPVRGRALPFTGRHHVLGLLTGEHVRSDVHGALVDRRRCPDRRVPTPPGRRGDAARSRIRARYATPIVVRA